MRGRARVATLIVVVIGALVGGGLLMVKQGRDSANRRIRHAAQEHSQLHRAELGAWKQPVCRRLPAGSLAGIVVKSPIGTSLHQDANTARIRFPLAEFYIKFEAPFPRHAALQAVRAGAMPVIQWNPRVVPLASIASGSYDSYLHSYAAAIKQFNCHVVMSFAHEMNGGWYPWGCTHTPASTFIAAWRHIVSIIRGPDVTWMWTTNVSLNKSCSLISRWPGSAYVDWVGIDGYLRSPGSTFDGVYRQTLAQVRQFAAGKPVLLAETAATPGARQSDRILSIYRGATRNHLKGVIYFDTSGKLANYQLVSPESLTAFQRGIKLYLKGSR